METVLIVIHLMIVIALVGVVLMQRSEGGGLGIGGGGGNFMSARGAANALTRATAILATIFFVTSLGLSIIARYSEDATDILDRVPTTQGESGGVLDAIGGAVGEESGATGSDAAPAVPDGAPAPDQPAVPNN